MWDERIGRGRPWSVRPSVGWSRSSGHAIHSIQYVWLVFGLEIAESFSMGPVRRRPRRAHARGSLKRANERPYWLLHSWVGATETTEHCTAALQHLALSCHKLIKLRHFSDSYGNTGHGAETTAALGVTTMADLDSSSLLLASRRTSAKVRQVCCYSLFMEMLAENNAAFRLFYDCLL